MNKSEKERLFATALAGYEPEIGRSMWAMDDTRRRTRRTLEGMDNSVLNWVPPEGDNSIGTLLYHVAAIEMDWLYTDILQEDFPSELESLLAYDVRDDQEKLTPVLGERLDQHMHRLETTRALLLSHFREITIEDFRRPRRFSDYDVTPEWVVHHLMQHEAEHRGQIGEVRVSAERAMETKKPSDG